MVHIGDNQRLLLSPHSMTDTLPDTTTTAPVSETIPTQEATNTPVAAPAKNRAQAVQPVLEQLFDLYPHLFGATFLPLKLGIFQELLAAHPGVLERDTLKLALSVHTRSTRYLQSVAAGKKRHDLAGVPVEDLAPEHIYFALLELHRRRQNRTQEDLRPKLRAQLVNAFEASGLDRQDYLARVQTSDADANALLEEALALRDEKLAKEAALLRAFDASGKTPDAFADMYGMALRDVTAALARRSKTAKPHQA
jgi:ProP effector